MAGTRFTNSVGYRGIVRLRGVILLATSGQFTQNHQPIVSQGVWGAGYYNAAQTVAYSNNIVRIEGSIGCEYTAGEEGKPSGIKAVKEFAFDHRGDPEGSAVKILPDGVTGFDAKHAWCTSLSFSLAQDQNMTGDMNFSSYVDGDDNRIITTSEKDIDTYGWQSSEAQLGESSGNLRDYLGVNDLYPYWNCQVLMADRGHSTVADMNAPFNKQADIMSFQASYNSSIEFLTCIGQGQNPDSKENPLAPDYLGLGPMDAQCQVEIFKLGDFFDPEAFHGQRGWKLWVKAGGTNPSLHTIKINNSVSQSTQGQITQGAGWISASFPYTAVGDGTQPPMALLEGWV